MPLQVGSQTRRRCLARLCDGQAAQAAILTAAHPTPPTHPPHPCFRQVATFNAYRVQHDNSRGPYKGGLRFHPQVGATYCWQDRLALSASAPCQAWRAPQHCGNPSPAPLTLFASLFTGGY